MIQMMRYAGSKVAHASAILQRIPVSAPIFVEPFLGSGAIFCNIADRYDRYVLNDLNSHIMSVWAFIKESTFADLLNVQNEMQSRYGMYTNKSAYYAIRRHYNEHMFNSTSVERGAHLYFLINSCINSLCRFGPNGFNQGYGNREYCMSPTDFASIKTKLQKAELSATQISCISTIH